MPFFELAGQNMYIAAAAAAGAIVIGAALFWLSLSKSAAKADFIRGVVGKNLDFKEGEPKAVKIEGAKNSILVVRHGGQLHAVGNKCPHAGAALNTGVFSCGRIVCPLHGASFDVATGEIEDAGPCLNQLPKFEVTLEGDDVIVCGSASVIDSKGSVPGMCSHESSDKRTFVIIGAGAAGAAAAEALRQAKFTGRIIVLSREKHLPYDRLQVTKDIKSTMESLLLRSNDFYRRIGVEVRLGVSGSEIDIQRKELKLSDGSTLSFDKALIATGSDARQVVEPSVLDNTFVLRTFEDLVRLRAKMRGARNFVIVGSSFIGLEACAMIKKHFDDAKNEDQMAQKIQITVIGMEKFPLERVLGAEIGQALQALHQENGVRFVMETVLQPSDYITQGGSITSIKTKNESICTDIVIVGAGAIPSLQKEDASAGFWSTTVPPVAPSGTLRVVGRPLLGNNSIAVDQHMHVANDVYAAGDIADMSFKGERIRVEHWGMAEQQGRVAAFHMAGSSDHRATLDAVPFFWTKQYGISVRYVGYCSKHDKILVEGDLKSRNKCSVFYTQGNSVRAVATIGCDPVAAAAAELLRLNQMPTAQAIEKRIVSKQPAGLALPELLKCCLTKGYNINSPWS